MSTLTRKIIRIAADAALFDSPKDLQTDASPQFWRGNDLQFEIGIFNNSVLQDVSNLSSLTIEIKAQAAGGGAPSPSDAALMLKTVTTLDNSLTLSSWNDGSAAHALIAFTADEANIAAGARWFAIRALTNDAPGRTITLAAGPIVVLEDGAGLATEPTPTEESFYTTAQSDGRYLNQTSNLSDLDDAAAARSHLGLGNSATRSVGTTTNTVAAGDDSRLIGAAQKSANLSDLNDFTIARRNLGITNRLAALKSGAAFKPGNEGIQDIALDSRYGTAGYPLLLKIKGVQLGLDEPASNVALFHLSGSLNASADLVNSLLGFVSPIGKITLRLYGSNATDYRQVATANSIFDSNTAFVEWADFALQLKADGSVAIYRDGVSLSLGSATTVNTNGTAPADFSEVKATDYLNIGCSVPAGNVGSYEGCIGNVRLLNIEPNATEIAIDAIDDTYLYRTYGWGNASLEPPSAFSDTGYAMGSFSGASTTGFTATTDGATDSADRAWIDFGSLKTIKGAYYELTYDYVIDGDFSGRFYQAAGNGGGASIDADDILLEGGIAGNALAQVELSAGSGTVRHIVKSTVAGEQIGYKFESRGSGVSVAISNFRIKRIGSIADWKFDEGIGYQFLDSSPNHYDGLLPESGVTWCHTKNEGVLRGRVSYAAESATKNLFADRRLLPSDARINDMKVEVAGSGIQNFSIGDGTDTDRWAASGYGSADYHDVTIANRKPSGTSDAVHEVTLTPAASATMDVDLWIKYQTR